MSLLTASENGAANSCESAPRVMRRMRKGTRSCTECRRRKVRCIFLPGTPDVCSRCGSRGLRCIDQRLVGVDTTEDEKKTLRDRVTRLEALLGSALGAAPKEALIQVEEGHYEFDQYAISSADSDDDYPLDPEAPLMSILNQTMKTFRVDNDNATTQQSEQTNSNPTTNSRVSHEGSAIDSEHYRRGTQRSRADDSSSSSRHLKTCAKLLAALPPYNELQQEVATKGQWWKSWREKTFGPTEGAEPLTEFASHVYSSRDVLEVALLVLAYARTAESQYSHYLHLVERLIISKDEYASRVKGLECIMLQAKCHLDFGQPRRAWLTYRRGLMLAQLTNFHKTYTTSPERAAIWWSLYHGDRFCSLLLGLPHSTHDLPSTTNQHSTPRSEEASTTTHLLMQKSGEIAGAVILLHQAPTVPQLSSILQLDEQLDEIAASMPPSWWDTRLPSPPSRSAESELRSRLLLHAYFLHVRMYLHLPLLLEPAASTRAILSRKSCLEAARKLLHRCTLLSSNLSALGTTPDDVLFDCKTNDFVGFAAAVVLLIGLAKAADSDQTQKAEDWGILERTRDFFLRLHALKSCKMTQQCYTALDTLMRAVDGSGLRVEGKPTKVFVPFFGNVCIKGKVPARSPYTCSATSGSIASASMLHHSQPADTVVAPTPNSGFDPGFDFAAGLEAFDDFEGIDAFLQDPSVMFTGAEPGTGSMNEGDMGMDFQWWNEQLVDIDGDWEMLKGR